MIKYGGGFMSDITFLKEEYFNKNINLIKKRGIIAPITDFAILLGGSVSEQNYYNNSNLLEDRAGYYWTSTVGNATDEIMIGGKCVETSTALLVRPDGSKKSILVQRRDVGARPAISYSSISSMCSNEKIASDGVLEVEYGEYPQQVVSKDLQEKLETLYLEGNLQKTGKLYITDSKVTDKHHIFDREFEPQVIMEYKDADGKNM